MGGAGIGLKVAAATFRPHSGRPSGGIVTHKPHSGFARPRLGVFATQENACGLAARTRGIIMPRSKAGPHLVGPGAHSAGPSARFAGNPCRIQVKVVSGAVEVYGQKEDRVEAILPAVGLGLHQEHLFGQAVGGRWFLRGSRSRGPLLWPPDGNMKRVASFREA